MTVFLDHLGRDVDLTGLEVLEKEQRLVRQARSDIEKQAALMMDRGMELQNQTQVCMVPQVAAVSRYNILGVVFKLPVAVPRKMSGEAAAE